MNKNGTNVYMKQVIITGLGFRILRFENLIENKIFVKVDFKKMESEECRRMFHDAGEK
jgi:hypothetical protein